MTTKKTPKRPAVRRQVPPVVLLRFRCIGCRATEDHKSLGIKVCNKCGCPMTLDRVEGKR